MTRLSTVFRNLHQDNLLVLANVGDAGSARIVESVGSKAVATSSAAVAWANGYQDGNQLPLKLLTTTVESMVRVLTVPLTVDVEGGYSDDLESVAKVIDCVVRAGAVGINIEDGAGSIDLILRKIEVAKKVASTRGIDLFVNVRTDVYLRCLVAPERQLAETISRASLFEQAGADGFFAAAMVEEYDIATLCEATRLPVNLLSWSGQPEIHELARLGVKRLSAGSSIAEFLLGANNALAKSFLRTGRLFEHQLDAFTYSDLNGLMAKTN
ncbi:isocitrate lyase/PEP mutase family protein [Pseudomonas sp.]|uniref:isocitrate lyase/PEP mutase family protein n=1 Tax=Pseudomonas sp. TaxID=306 RepID=UPI003FD8F5C5